MRKKIYKMVHIYEGNPVSVIYKYCMISSFFGIAIVALPAGIVTAEYLGTLKEKDGKNGWMTTVSNTNCGILSRKNPRWRS